MPSTRPFLLAALALACGSPSTAEDAGERDSGRADASTSSLDGGEHVADAGGDPGDLGVSDGGAVLDAGPTHGPLVPEPVLKAFPAAYGGGAEATGGRGGVLVIIDTLDYAAPLVYDDEADVYRGGFEAAFEDPLDGRPRSIVSEVAGVIDGNARRQVGGGVYVVGGGNVTFFGQSAPAGGLTLTRSWIHYDVSENLIFRHLTVRTALINGDPIPDDHRTSPFLLEASSVMVDHVSASWGGDKGLMVGTWGPGNPMRAITVQRSLVADSHTLGFSVDGVNQGEDWELGRDVCWYANFFAGGNRTPNIGGFDGLGEVRNNVVHSAGDHLTTVVFGSPRINYVGNYVRAATDQVIPNRFQPIGTSQPSIYAAGTYYETASGVVLDGTAGQDDHQVWITTVDDGPVPAEIFSSAEHPPPPHPPAPLTALEAKASVLADVGHNRYLTDDGEVAFAPNGYDRSAVEDLELGRHRFRTFSSDWVLDPVPEVRRPATYDTDSDGMADAWERRHFGDLSRGYNGDEDGDGYTNLEEYMNQVDYVPAPAG